jgi:hypothetical protein
MMAEQNQPDALERRRRLRTGLIVSTLLGIVLLATACAGGSNALGVAGQGSSSTPSATPSSDTGDAELPFAQCMRDDGISDFPDPQPGSAIQFEPGSDLDSNNPQFEAPRTPASRCFRRPRPRSGRRARRSSISL